MGLQGDLNSFPIDSVLTLLEMTHKTGLLNLKSTSWSPTLMIDRGQLSFASASDASLVDELVESNIIGTDDIRSLRDAGALNSLGLEEKIGPDAFRSFVTERIYDVLFRTMWLAERETIYFEFSETKLPEPTSDVLLPREESLAEAASRVAEWAEVQQVIPTPDTKVLPNVNMPNEKVLLDRMAWRLIAMLASPASVTDLSARLKVGDFQMARALAQLVNDGLLTVVDGTGEESSVFGEASSGGFSNDTDPDITDPEEIPAGALPGSDAETPSLLGRVRATGHDRPVSRRLRS